MKNVAIKDLHGRNDAISRGHHEQSNDRKGAYRYDEIMFIVCGTEPS